MRKRDRIISKLFKMAHAFDHPLDVVIVAIVVLYAVSLVFN